ncbi:shikimate dehydrogenase family protein [Haloplasma contractile]|uniref:Shikimate dehydrogenase protein n=1 Tax=Haloplasma contractile SSD-17B TaxID=1033810 RepID=U2FFG5_9MOLU|nr:Shikimate dehydrogenase protein [Haloplasma contractile]ERJ11660.1 Shikimate dehydrogenase protein [Haloplasma contractile SSD-17B]
MSSIYGLLGERLSHSLSPVIHNEIFKTLGDECYYHLFEVERDCLSDAIKGLKALKTKGVNVTIPYKIEVIKHLDEHSDETLKIGAVNTIVFRQNKTIGYNTDYFGFGMMLKAFNIDVKIKKQLY